MAKGKNIVGAAKGSVTLGIVALIAIGWLLVLAGMADDKEKEAQDALVKQAEKYEEDRLYIRAISCYSEALEHKTKENPNIEARMVKAYKDGGMLEDYYKLIVRRIESGTATEEEIIELGNVYYEKGDYSALVRNLDQARTMYPDNTEIRDIYESARYTHNTSTTNFETVKLPAGEIMPAFNGEKWGYISSNGSQELEFIYDEATPFCGDYAAVKQDGENVVINKKGRWYSIDKDSVTMTKRIGKYAIVAEKNGKCVIYSKDYKRLSDEEYDDVILNDSNNTAFVKKGDQWSLLSNELKEVTSTKFKDVAINQKGTAFEAGYAVVADERGYYLIYSDGSACFDKRFPNAKGIEESYVAVQDANGKWGFVNDKGDYVLESQYEDAYSFSSSLAAVCKDGKWGYVNRYGTMVIKNEYYDAYPFTGEYAMAKNQENKVVILKLRFYDYIKKK